jgi:hypothetical protein
MQSGKTANIHGCTAIKLITVECEIYSSHNLHNAKFVPHVLAFRLVNGRGDRCYSN